MSMLIIGKFQGDTGKFRQSLAERAGEFEKWGAAGRAAGAVHHRFGVGDGCVVVIDEWESVEQFQEFFSDPELQAFIRDPELQAFIRPELQAFHRGDRRQPRPAGDDHRGGRPVARRVLAACRAAPAATRPAPAGQAGHADRHAA